MGAKKGGCELEVQDGRTKVCAVSELPYGLLRQVDKLADLHTTSVDEKHLVAHLPRVCRPRLSLVVRKKHEGERVQRCGGGIRDQRARNASLCTPGLAPLYSRAAA